MYAPEGDDHENQEQNVNLRKSFGVGARGQWGEGEPVSVLDYNLGKDVAVYRAATARGVSTYGAALSLRTIAFSIAAFSF